MNTKIIILKLSLVLRDVIYIFIFSEVLLVSFSVTVVKCNKEASNYAARVT